ncbi:hypothetical protein [Nocardioides panacisoli]|uniref:DUF1795 domain-containing protein n=1 Tax=Nocardioides panacisoli TaxID=627624 RepID=A0ABP7IY30_9ACTN
MEMHTTGAPAGRDVLVTVPARWHRREDLKHGVVVAARARAAPPSGHPPELVVRCAAVEESLATWRAGAIAALARQLPAFALEDRDEFDLGEQPVAYHRFGHRLGTLELLSEQWAWLVDGLGVTLTCTAAREDYPAFCDLFEAVAATVDVMPAAA